MSMHVREGTRKARRKQHGATIRKDRKEKKTHQGRERERATPREQKGRKEEQGKK